MIKIPLVFKVSSITHLKSRGIKLTLNNQEKNNLLRQCSHLRYWDKTYNLILKICQKDFKRPPQENKNTIRLVVLVGKPISKRTVSCIKLKSENNVSIPNNTMYIIIAISACRIKKRNRFLFICVKKKVRVRGFEPPTSTVHHIVAIINPLLDLIAQVFMSVAL